ncbi:hypothetical protein SLA2020_353190 [Shorea laevis]
MKLHQPGFRHERDVVEGFGHSDLLNGEESHKKVFPHILSHIRLAEQGKKHHDKFRGKDIQQGGARLSFKLTTLSVKVSSVETVDIVTVWPSGLRRQI